MSNKEKYHNKGQSDGASGGDRKPPYSDLDIWTSTQSRRLQDENDAYNKGYKQGKNSKK